MKEKAINSKFTRPSTTWRDLNYLTLKIHVGGPQTSQNLPLKSCWLGIPSLTRCNPRGEFPPFALHFDRWLEKCPSGFIRSTRKAYPRPYYTRAPTWSLYKSSDWFNFGSLIYHLLQKTPPWYDQDSDIYQKAVLEEKLRWITFFPYEASDLLQKLLTKDPNNRLQNPNEIKSHPWFKRVKLRKFEANDK